MKSGKIIAAFSIAFAMLEALEGLKVESYKDEGGVKTICYGDTRLGVDTASKAACEAALSYKVESLIRNYAYLAQNEFQLAAIVSFVYNIGENAFKKSKMFQSLKRGDYNGAAKEFKRWVYVKGVKSKGLEKRRDKEEALFKRGSE